MTIWEEERRERLHKETNDLAKWMKGVKGIHKMELEELMINYIEDNDLDIEDIEVIRLFVKYLKEQ